MAFAASQALESAVISGPGERDFRGVAKMTRHASAIPSVFLDRSADVIE